MKTLRQLFATILLALVLGVPAIAGDMGGATSPSPTPSPLALVVANTNNPTFTPLAIPAVEPPTLTEVAFDFLLCALSMY
ncbi:MAG TPA: hypothetical protein VN920_04775 [Pyrinomonadaceae bacterium]|nr:hypothetical protein [Pyrinomonadaceae bacterium]